jgi:hypothetical protein
LHAKKRIDPIIINIYPYKTLMHDMTIGFSKIMVGIDGSEKSMKKLA